MYIGSVQILQCQEIVIHLDTCNNAYVFPEPQSHSWRLSWSSAITSYYQDITFYPNLGSFYFPMTAFSLFWYVLVLYYCST